MKISNAKIARMNDKELQELIDNDDENAEAAEQELDRRERDKSENEAIYGEDGRNDPALPDDYHYNNR